VNGKVLTVKGVCYAPTPIGESPESQSPYGDYFTSGYRQIYSRDLPLLKTMGCNVVRLYGWNKDADHEDFLNECRNNGIYVIVGFWINGGQDLSNSTVRQKIKDDFVTMVRNNKNHPAVLFWSAGNEMNGDWMYGNSGHWYSLLDELAQVSHQEEGASYHPVTTANLEINYIAQRDPELTHLDLWMINAYRGDNFGDLFDKFATASQRPLVISEFGIDAWDNRNSAEYESTQASYALSLWNDITAHANICAGGCLFEYCDEWWKDRKGQLTAHDFGGYAASSHPDGFSNEEWWGIMRTSDNGSDPDIMNPRQIYNVMKEKWSF